MADSFLNNFQARAGIIDTSTWNRPKIIQRNMQIIKPFRYKNLYKFKRVGHCNSWRYDSATLLAMVREGLGITLLPRMMLPKKLEGVVALPLNPPQMLQIGLAVRSQEIASPAAVLFVQTVLAWMQEVGEIS
ncbi:transcriptional regulator [Paenibacillus sabinae T27]|uniref:Transcriptional regulator n=2 Tax=Paenibacillus sabinae TaxID=365617 RepID=X4Z6R2_9BACL|nr:transcriptional regulator [Paenibacillus sabinae T27]